MNCYVFPVDSFEWRHSWPHTSFSGQRFYMQSNKCNLWSKTNVTILSRLFHPYTNSFQHGCSVQDNTWMVSNRSAVVILIMAQPRFLISTVGKMAAGRMEESFLKKMLQK